MRKLPVKSVNPPKEQEKEAPINVEEPEEEEPTNAEFEEPVNAEEPEREEAPLHERRKTRAPERYMGWRVQDQRLEREMRIETTKKTEKNKNKNKNKDKSKSTFARLFDELNVHDWSFLLKKELSAEERKMKQRLYDFFALKEDKNDGRSERSASRVEDAYNVYVSILLWTFCQKKRREYEDAKYFTFGLDQFLEHYLRENHPESASVVRGYLDRSTRHCESTNA